MKNINLIFLTICIFLLTIAFNVSTIMDGNDLKAEISFFGKEVKTATIQEPALSCNDLSNCPDGAGCDGAGKMLGPCSFKCDPGPKVDCDDSGSEIGEN